MDGTDMIAKTITRADNPDINIAIPNLDAVVGSFPLFLNQSKKGTKMSVNKTIHNGFID
jgi:hypothetical protein